jgi:hypothetical protein
MGEVNLFKKLGNSCLIKTRGYMQRYKDQGTTFWYEIGLILFPLQISHLLIDNQHLAFNALKMK